MRFATSKLFSSRKAGRSDGLGTIGAMEILANLLLGADERHDSIISSEAEEGSLCNDERVRALLTIFSHGSEFLRNHRRRLEQSYNNNVVSKTTKNPSDHRETHPFH